MPREPLTPSATDEAEDNPAPTPRRPRGRTPELHTGDMAIEQKPDITDPDEYEGDIVLVDPDAHLNTKSFKDALAFMEEPVTIRIEPSNEKNAPTSYPVWINGEGAEVLQAGRWMKIAYLPVARMLTVKRKVVEVLIRTKSDSIQTRDTEVTDIDRGLGNTISRQTSAAVNLTILEDRNPRGAAWATEMRRRNF